MGQHGSHHELRIHVSSHASATATPPAIVEDGSIVGGPPIPPTQGAQSPMLTPDCCSTSDSSACLSPESSVSPQPLTPPPEASDRHRRHFRKGSRFRRHHKEADPARSASVPDGLNAQGQRPVRKHSLFHRLKSPHHSTASGDRSPGSTLTRKGSYFLHHSLLDLHDETDMLHPDGASPGVELAAHTELYHKRVERHTTKAARAKKYRKYVTPIQGRDHVLRLHTEDARFISKGWQTFSSEGCMTLQQFKDCLNQFADDGWAHLDTPFVDRLFALFDQGDKGTLDEGDFDEGLALLTVGTPEEKVRLTFQIFDMTRTGLIGMGEFYRACKTAFKHALKVAKSEETKERALRELSVLEKKSSQLVRDYVDSVFAKWNHHDDHQLRFLEFAAWLREDPTLATRLTSGSSHATYFSITHSGCGHHDEEASVKLAHEHTASSDSDSGPALSGEEALRSRGIFLGHGEHAGMDLEFGEGTGSLSGSSSRSQSTGDLVAMERAKLVPRKKGSSRRDSTGPSGVASADEGQQGEGQHRSQSGDVVAAEPVVRKHKAKQRSYGARLQPSDATRGHRGSRRHASQAHRQGKRRYHSQSRLQAPPAQSPDHIPPPTNSKEAVAAARHWAAQRALAELDQRTAALEKREKELTAAQAALKAREEALLRERSAFADQQQLFQQWLLQQQHQTKLEKASVLQKQEEAAPTREGGPCVLVVVASQSSSTVKQSTEADADADDVPCPEQDTSSHPSLPAPTTAHAMPTDTTPQVVSSPTPIIQTSMDATVNA